MAGALETRSDWRSEKTEEIGGGSGRAGWLLGLEFAKSWAWSR